MTYRDFYKEYHGSSLKDGKKVIRHGVFYSCFDVFHNTNKY